METRGRRGVKQIENRKLEPHSRRLVTVDRLEFMDQVEVGVEEYWCAAQIPAAKRKSRRGRNQVRFRCDRSAGVPLNIWGKVGITEFTLDCVPAKELERVWSIGREIAERVGPLLGEADPRFVIVSIRVRTVSPVFIGASETAIVPPPAAPRIARWQIDSAWRSAGPSGVPRHRTCEWVSAAPERPCPSAAAMHSGQL